MAMKNYRVEQADGEVQYYQIDKEDTAGGGEAIYESFKAAEKDDDNPVVKVTQADPKPGELVADDVQNQ